MALLTLQDYATLAGVDLETASDAFANAGQLVGNIPLKAGARLVRDWVREDASDLGLCPCDLEYPKLCGMHPGEAS